MPFYGEEVGTDVETAVEQIINNKNKIEPRKPTMQLSDTKRTNKSLVSNQAPVPVDMCDPIQKKFEQNQVKKPNIGVEPSPANSATQSVVVASETNITQPFSSDLKQSQHACVDTTFSSNKWMPCYVAVAAPIEEKKDRQ